MRHLTIITTIIIVISTTSYAQDFTQEVSSVDKIVSALYGTISGEKGEPRDWNLFHYLFTENAQLIPTSKDAEGQVGFQSLSPKEYQQKSSEWLVSNGFHEVEIYRVIETYGPVAHIFSTYESRNSITDIKPFARGINSIQLMYDEKRWWIMNIFWSGETTENPIPVKYLPR